MKKDSLKKKKGGLLCLLTAGLLVVTGFAFSELKLNSEISASAEIFYSSNGVTVQKNAVVEAVGIEDSRSGIQLSASTSGASITVAEEMRGLFELNFRAFSPTAYAHSNVFYGENISNYALTLNTMSLIFTDTSDATKTFRVGIDGASKQNFATPQAYVEAGGIRGGIYTHPEGFASTQETNPNPIVWDRSSTDTFGNTTGANANNQYTALWRTSFSNAGYTASQTWDGADTRLSTPNSNYIYFDPVSMRVYSKTTSDGAETLIWDLSQEYNDGKKGVVLDPFAAYSVTLEFTDIVYNTTADILIYSLNGQSLAGDSYTNNMGASVFADFSKQAVKGQKYKLPTPYYYDVLNNMNKSVAVSVTVGKETLNVYNASGKPVQTYLNGCYVVPNTTGDMTITYTAKDSDGYNGLPLQAKVKVFNEQPKTDYTVHGRMEQGELGVGTVLTLPTATAVNAIDKEVSDVFVTVKKNGSVVEGYENKPANFSYKIALTEKANYIVEYKAAGVDDALTYAIATVDTIAAFNTETVLPEVAYTSTSLLIPSATAVFGTETKTATTYIRFPSGGLYQANSIYFEKDGKYSVEYSAEFNGKVYTKIYPITVAAEQATFTGGGINAVVSPGTASERYDEITGVRIDSSSSFDVFTYSQKIDLSQSTQDDLLIEIFNSAPWGTNAGEGLTVTITDAYDPTNYITVEARSYWYYNTVWVKAAATGQSFSGFEGATLHGSNSPYGTIADYNTHSHLGETRAWESFIADYSSLGFKLFYDNAEKAIYTQRAGAKNRIVGFTDSHQIEPWSGFTTGEVYLSVTGFTSIVVTEVYKNDLSGDKFYGGTTDIYVDTFGLDETELPNAIAGKPYPIFDAYAINSREGRISDLSVAVFRNYAQPSFFEYEVFDGKFTPELPGIYTIVYSWRDQYHNETVKTIRVRAIAQDAIDPVYLSVADGDSSVIVGEYYTLPIVQDCGGGIGSLTHSITVTNEKGEEQAIVNNRFFALDSCEYTIEYRVFDFIGSGSPNEVVVLRKVQAIIQDSPILYDTVLPAYVLSGMDLKLPAVNAIDFKSDDKGVAPTMTSITAVLDGKTVNINADNICRPEVETGHTKDMTVTYRAASAYGTSEKSYTVKVVNPGTKRGYLWDYFQPVSGSFTKSKFETLGTSYKELTLTSSDDNAAVQFINPVLAHGLELNLSAMNSNTDKVIITLYDSENMEISVRFEIIKNLVETETYSGSYFSINGGTIAETTGNFYSVEAGLGLRYSQNTFEVSDNNGNVIGIIKETENGDAFNGFPSNKVWVEIGFGNITDSFELRINKIGSQSISDRGLSSHADPAFYCTDFLPLQCAVGETITLPIMVAQSTVTPRTSVSVRVLTLTSDGFEDTEILSPTPVNTPIQVTLSEYVNYRVIYEISDGNGRNVAIDYLIYMIEKEPPTLSLKGSVPNSVKLGAKVTLPEGIAKDNLAKNPVVRIYVITPSRETYILDDSRSFTAKQSGQYVIRYYVYDDCYNYTIQNYAIVVK